MLTASLQNFKIWWNRKFVRQHSLQSYLSKKQFGISVLLFVFMLGILIFQYTVGITQDILISSKLDARHISRQFEILATVDNETPKLLKLASTTGYRHWSALPSKIRSTLGEDVDIEADTFIEGEYLQAGETIYFSIFVYKEKSGQLLFVVEEYPLTEIDEIVDNHIQRVMIYSFVTLASFSLLLFTLTRRWMRQLSLPFSQMQRWAESLGKDNALPREKYQFDEFNQLAQQLEIAMQRVGEFNQREQQFLKHASHEFRTPIAIVQATLDTLLEQYQSDKRLMRIRHAMDNMQTISTTLLWLARESKVREEADTVDLRELCEIIEADLSYLKQNKAVFVTFSGQGRITEQTALVRITLENLIRNAYQHSTDGEINIVITEWGLSITNPYEHHGSTQGFGLGLELVQRICQKQGWRIVVNKGETEFTTEIGFLT